MTKTEYNNFRQSIGSILCGLECGIDNVINIPMNEDVLKRSLMGIQENYSKLFDKINELEKTIE